MGMVTRLHQKWCGLFAHFDSEVFTFSKPEFPRTVLNPLRVWLTCRNCGHETQGWTL